MAKKKFKHYRAKSCSSCRKTPCNCSMKEEHDYEYEMARNQLATASRSIERLMGMLKGEGNLEAWVQSKLTMAADYLDTVADYMESDKNEETQSNDTKIIKEEDIPPHNAGSRKAFGLIKKIPGAMKGKPNKQHLEGLASDANDNYPRSSTRIGNPHKEGTKEHQQWHNGYMDEIHSYLDLHVRKPYHTSK